MGQDLKNGLQRVRQGRPIYLRPISTRALRLTFPVGRGGPISVIRLLRTNRDGEVTFSLFSRPSEFTRQLEYVRDNGVHHPPLRGRHDRPAIGALFDCQLRHVDTSADEDAAVFQATKRSYVWLLPVVDHSVLSVTNVFRPPFSLRKEGAYVRRNFRLVQAIRILRQGRVFITSSLHPYHVSRHVKRTTVLNTFSTVNAASARDNTRVALPTVTSTRNTIRGCFRQGNDHFQYPTGLIRQRFAYRGRLYGTYNFRRASLFQYTIIHLHTNIGQGEERIRPNGPRVLGSRNVHPSAPRVPSRPFNFFRLVFFRCHIGHGVSTNTVRVHVLTGLACVVREITNDEAHARLKHASVSNVNAIVGHFGPTVRIFDQERGFCEAKFYLRTVVSCFLVAGRPAY